MFNKSAFKRLRKNAGLNYSKISALMGLAVSSISRWEKDPERQPSPAHVIKLAEILGVSVKDLYTDESAPAPVPGLYNVPLFLDFTRRTRNAPDGWLTLPLEVLGALDPNSPPYALKMDDNAMSDAGIPLGAFVVCNPTKKPTRCQVGHVRCGDTDLVRFVTATEQGLTLADAQGQVLCFTPDDGAFLVSSVVYVLTGFKPKMTGVKSRKSR